MTEEATEAAVEPQEQEETQELASQASPPAETFELPEGHWAADDSLYEAMDDDVALDAKKLAARFDSPSKQLAAHLSAHQLRGQSVRLPKADATPEEKAEIYRKIWTKMGCPEDMSNYEVSEIEGLPEGFKLSEEKLTQGKELAHKYGLTQEGFKDFLQMHMKMATDLLGQFEAEKQHIAEEKKKLEEADWDKAKSGLKSEWGADYENRFKKGQEWAKQKLTDKLAWAKHCYEMYVRDIAEGKSFEGSGFGQPVKTIFDSHEGEE